MLEPYFNFYKWLLSLFKSNFIKFCHSIYVSVLGFCVLTTCWELILNKASAHVNDVIIWCGYWWVIYYSIYTHALVMLTVQRVCCYYASGFVCITRLGWLLLTANTAKRRHIDSDGITNKYVYKHYYSNILDKTIYMTKTLKINTNFDNNTNRHQNSI